MSTFDNIKDKASELLDKVDTSKVDEAVDAAGDKVDDMTGGKYADHVDSAQDAVKGLVDKVDGDDAPAAAPPA